jgi:cobalt-zinc-cadmium efflux system outer membrane protein
MRLVSWPAIAGVCALLVGGEASAQTTHGASEPLRLLDALKRALAQQPELQGFAFELRAQEARISEAGLRQPTQFDALIEDAGGTGERRGIDTAQTTLSLSHVIELGGKRDGRVALAEATRARMQTEQAARQLDVAAEVARRFVETLHAQEQLRIAHDALTLAEQTREGVDRRVKAALAPAAEAARAEVRLTQAKLDLTHAEHERETSRRFLAAAMGERNVRFGETVGDLFALTSVAPLDDLLKRIEASPDFLRFADEARVRDAEIRLAELKRLPDLRTQIGLRRYEQGDDIGLVAGFSLPLQSSRRAQSGIDLARADRARNDAEREAAFLKAQAQLFAQYRELEHSRLEASALRETIVPQLEKALQKTEYAYQRGRYSYLEWIDAQRELLDARRRASDVAAAFHTLLIEIERLTGETLDVTGETP